MRKFPIGGFTALFAIGAAIFALSGCYKDNFDFNKVKQDPITWEPDIAFPIVYSTMDAEEIISISDSTNIYQYDGNNFITLIYRRRVFSQTVNDFFQFPFNQQVNENMSFGAVEIAQFTANGSASTTTNSGITFGISGPGGSQLDHVTFHSGTMTIAFTSDFQHSGTLQVSMPEMKLNGVPFLQSYPINYQGGSVNYTIDIPLAGYTMNLNNGNGPNTIPIDYTLTLNQGNGAVPTPVNQVQITHSFQEMVMQYADGDFGNFSLVINPGEVELDVEQGSHGGHLYFEDPRFKLHVKNSIGAEIQVGIDQLYASGNAGQLNIDVSSLIPSGQFTIAGAPSVGDSSITDFYFTKDNSNISQVVNGDYDKVNHALSAQVNPNGPATNFATLNSAIEVVADVELPFWGYSDHFTIIDTVEVPFDDASDFADNIEHGLLRINTVSHFPVDGLLKLYFADSNHVVLDSVLTDGSFIIRSGQVNADGKTIASTQTNNDVELDTTRINSLFDSRYLLIYADLTSTDDAGRNIKLYTEDNIEVRIGLRVKLKAKPSDINKF
ncbi:MAG: hypothetical protein GC178_04415 [Flavobacteriales bacterium]|nr:hypothetical protein [Flavobacteriales bacterium]